MGFLKALKKVLGFKIEKEQHVPEKIQEKVNEVEQPKEEPKVEEPKVSVVDKTEENLVWDGSKLELEKKAKEPKKPKKSKKTQKPKMSSNIEVKKKSK